MAVQIRIAASDFARLDEVHALLMANFAYMIPRIDPPSSLMKMSVDGLNRKAALEQLVIAMDGNEIVGCGFLRRNPTAIYVSKLAVDKRYRGRGIARAILMEADKFARAEGLCALELETRIELVENHAAFAHLGFMRTAHTSHKGYDHPTSVTMRRAVASEPTGAST